MPWEFVGLPELHAFRGQKAMRGKATGLGQQLFTDATSGLKIGEGARLFAYVFLDPKDPPKTVMLQFNDGDWEHRDFWGADSIPLGAGDNEGHRSMGPLPEAGKWARLEVDAAYVGLRPGTELNGWAFAQTTAPVTGTRPAARISRPPGTGWRRCTSCSTINRPSMRSSPGTLRRSSASAIFTQPIRNGSGPSPNTAKSSLFSRLMSPC